MLIYWEMTGINYDPLFMAIAGAPLPMFLKVSSVLNAGAATERILVRVMPDTSRVCKLQLVGEPASCRLLIDIFPGPIFSNRVPKNLPYKVLQLLDGAQLSTWLN